MTYKKELYRKHLEAHFGLKADDSEVQATALFERLTKSGDITEIDGEVVLYLPSVSVTVKAKPGAEPAADDVDARIKVLEDTLAGAKTPKKDAPNVAAQARDEKTEGRWGYKCFSEFMQTVAFASRGDGKALRRINEAQELGRKTVGTDEMEAGDDSEGGFLVPTEYRNELFQRTLETGAILGRTREMPMSVTQLEVPAVNETTRATTTAGGIRSYWTAEKGAKTASKPALRGIKLHLHDLVALVPVTNQLLEDSPISIEALLTTLCTDNLVFSLENAIISGTGAGQPLGVLTAGTGITLQVTAEDNQAADTIVTENLLKMYARMAPGSYNNAVWFANANTFPQLASMVLAVGAGGTAVWLPGGNVAGAPNGTLLGRPLVLTEHCPTVGDAGDLLFADLSQYWLGRKTGGQWIRSASSMHVRFEYNEMEYRFELRVDGQPAWNSAITPKNGDSFSPFVTIAARA